MANLEIRKKTATIWEHSQIGSIGQNHILSLGYFAIKNNVYTLYTNSGGRIVVADLSEITLFDDTDAGLPETFTDSLVFTTRLSELLYPYINMSPMAVDVISSVIPKIEVARENVKGQSYENVFGNNPNLGTEIEDIWDAGDLSILNYDTQTGNFTPALTITGGTSTATAIIVIDDDSGATGVLTIREINGTFVTGEIITDTSTGSATTNGTPIPTLKLDYPTSGETWEVICESSNDTLLGTGSRTLTLVSLDTNYVEQTTTVDLNGQTAATISGTHFRTKILFTTAAGSLQMNDKTIVLRVAGGGAVRMIIQPNFSNDFDTHFTVEAGKTAYLLELIAFIPKNEDVELNVRYLLFGTNTWRSLSRVDMYQSNTHVPLSAIPSFPEKTDLRVEGKSTNSAQTISTTLGLLLIDN